MDEETLKQAVDAELDDDLFLNRVLLDFEDRLGARRTPPKGMTYADVLEALTTSARIRAKLG